MMQRVNVIESQRMKNISSNNSRNNYTNSINRKETLHIVKIMYTDNYVCISILLTNKESKTSEKKCKMLMQKLISLHIFLRKTWGKNLGYNHRQCNISQNSILTKIRCNLESIKMISILWIVYRRKTSKCTKVQLVQGASLHFRQHLRRQTNTIIMFYTNTCQLHYLCYQIANNHHRVHRKET